MKHLPLYFSFSVTSYQMAVKTVKLTHRNDYAFISLHVDEENNSRYVQNAKKICHLLDKHHLKIIADISPRSLKMFKQKSYIALAKMLHLSIFRVDYGLSINEINKLAKQMPIAVNASTMNIDDIKKIKSINKNIIAIHNFYPRPETGLDLTTFSKMTNAIRALDIPVMAFISSNAFSRGPLYQG
ncbi:MAG: MupG family TIM beta-alpha barrel fold protein, partial [Bacilli bacterium]|nr:MupG family TIM beta-alpha barrel fold protein [Bacilli bacterium]